LFTLFEGLKTKILLLLLFCQKFQLIIEDLILTQIKGMKEQLPQVTFEFQRLQSKRTNFSLKVNPITAWFSQYSSQIARKTSC